MKRAFSHGAAAACCGLITQQLTLRGDARRQRTESPLFASSSGFPSTASARPTWSPPSASCCARRARAWRRSPPTRPRAPPQHHGRAGPPHRAAGLRHGVVRHLESVATYPELRAAYNAVQPQVSAFYSGIPLNSGLWQASRAFAATAEGRADRRAAALSAQDHRELSPPWRRSGRRRQEAAGRDRRRADAGHHQVRRKRARFHQRLRAGDYRCGRTGRPAAHRRGRRPRERRAQGPGRLAIHPAGARLLRGDDLPGQRRHAPPGVPGYSRPRHRGATRQPAADRAHSGIARARRPACWDSAISPTWCWKTAWPTTAPAPWRFWKI